MNHRNNRRSEATKTKIKQALVDMLHHQELSKITVQALCEEASINRSTFYNHYQSPQSVLKNIEKDFIFGLNNYVSADSHPEQETSDLCQLLTRVLEYTQANQHICFLLQIPALQPAFRKNIFDSLFHSGTADHPAFEKYSDEMLAYTQTFVMYGCGHVIELWLQGGCKESPYEIACLLAGFIEKL